MDIDPGALTPISRLGEFGLIHHLTKDIKLRHEFVAKGIGDDAAVIRLGSGQVQLVSTDMLLEGIHFDLSYMPLKHLGFKAVAVNVSDIAAMNGRAYGITVSIGMSSRFSVEALVELYEGIKLACDSYDVDLLGGDTCSSKQGLTISVTVMGMGREDLLAYRSGAQEKDLICVSGDVGGAYAGFLVLDREKSAYIDAPNAQPDLSDYDYVVGRQLRPQARVDVINKLAEIGVKPTSMIDVSDGLASEIHHICKSSKKGSKIFSNKLPIDFQTVSVAEEFKISPTTFAMNGGEDYELLFTVPLSDFEKIKALEEISIIGHITSDENIMQIVLDTGQVVDIEAQGWEHFSE